MIYAGSRRGNAVGCCGNCMETTFDNFHLIIDKLYEFLPSLSNPSLSNSCKMIADKKETPTIITKNLKINQNDIKYLAAVAYVDELIYHLACKPEEFLSSGYEIVSSQLKTKLINSILLFSSDESQNNEESIKDELTIIINGGLGSGNSHKYCNEIIESLVIFIS